MDFGQCSHKINYKKILLKDKKSSEITFSNEDIIEVNKIQVDDCLEIEGVKCDWLIIISKPYIEIYIELKGSDVDHAFKQIENTIKILSKDYKNVIKYCYVITTRCPLTSAQIQNKQKTFKKNYNAVLRVRKTGCIENINTLITDNCI